MKSAMNKRVVGKQYEDMAVSYLSENAYIIIDRNFFTKIGEIDIIGKNDGYLCFIEVKYRDKYGLTSGIEAVDKRKQHTIYKVAELYMMKNKIMQDTPCRFDVVSIDGTEITLIKNAF